MNRAKTENVLRTLLDIGTDHHLGGTGEPVALVVIYPNAAFLKAGEEGINREHAVQALMDALEDEVRKSAGG